MTTQGIQNSIKKSIEQDGGCYFEKNRYAKVLQGKFEEKIVKIVEQTPQTIYNMQNVEVKLKSGITRFVSEQALIYCDKEGRTLLGIKSDPARAHQFNPNSLDTEKIQLWSHSTMITAEMTLENARNGVAKGNLFVISSQAVGYINDLLS